MSLKSVINKWKSYAPYFLSILRIVAAVIFMMAGTMKLFGYPIGMPPNGATARFFTEIWFAGVLEVYGGALIAFGLFTRPVAFLLSGEMAVAYFQAHFPMSPWPIVNNGISAILYCFIWLYFSAAGSGKWSIDALIASKKNKNL